MRRGACHGSSRRPSPTFSGNRCGVATTGRFVARCAGVPQERLTRHEISWLLAQEARGAAKTLRTEVQELRAPGEVRPTPAPVQTTLDALDDTIEMLSALNAERR